MLVQSAILNCFAFIDCETFASLFHSLHTKHVISCNMLKICSEIVFTCDYVTVSLSHCYMLIKLLRNSWFCKILVMKKIFNFFYLRNFYTRFEPCLSHLTTGGGLLGG